jgi:hypothetical protein
VITHDRSADGCFHITVCYPPARLNIQNLAAGTDRKGF